MLVGLKLSCKDANVGTALGWALSWDHIIDLGRLIVVIRHVIIGVVLVVKREVDASDRDSIKSCWRDTRHLCRVDQTSRCLHIQV